MFATNIAGTRLRNTGNVFLDNPDRKVPFSRQFTIGYQRELFGDVAVSVDYVRAENRDQIMRRNLNPPLRTDTARTAPVVRPDAEFVQNVWQPVNVGWYRLESDAWFMLASDSWFKGRPSRRRRKSSTRSAWKPDDAVYLWRSSRETSSPKKPLSFVIPGDHA